MIAALLYRWSVMMNREEQTRFAQFIRPIRDLNKNWDVDVATQLEEYLVEVRDHVLGGWVGLTSLVCRCVIYMYK